MPFYSMLIFAAATALAFGIVLRLVIASRDRSARRAAYFDEIKGLFEKGETRLQPTGFPRMSASKAGLAFDLQVLPDSLTFRKVPALWVMASLPEPIPVDAVLDVMSRPSGHEPFSRFAELPQSLPSPAFLREGIAIRSDDASKVPPQDLLARHAKIFDDPAVKELLISPKGLRIVLLAEEADRGRYLIFRDAEMGQMPLSVASLAPILDRLAALREDLHYWAREQT